MSAPWNGKTVLVCGASAGLGFQLAASLVNRNADVIIAARNIDRLMQAKDELLRRHPTANVYPIAADLTDDTDVCRLANEIRDQHKRLYLVINAIGESDRGSISDLKCDRLIHLFQRNVCSGLLTLQHLAPLLHARQSDQRGGAFVLIGSLSSHFAPRFLGGYSIVKHGVAALAQQARLELAEKGIHVMLASPGPIARNDAGTRYNNLSEAIGIPQEAMKSGGGAKIKGLDPVQLSEQILDGVAARKTLLILPRKARLLLIVFALNPRLGDYLLRRLTT